MLELKHIYKSYKDIQVLRDVSLKVSRGELVGIIGRSGAGKSTLLHIAGTLEQPDRGEVWIQDSQIQELKGNTLADFRNAHIGFIFQFHHLLPEFTALENVMIPSLVAGTSRSTAGDKAKILLDKVGLSHRYTHKPGALSGGEQQRVAIARALINDPHIVFADEPTGNLDSASSKEVHDLFLKLNEELLQTFMIVTHNDSLADICTRTVTMEDGQMIEQPLHDG